MKSRSLILALVGVVALVGNCIAESLPNQPIEKLRFFDGSDLLTTTDAWSVEGDELVCSGAPYGYLVLSEKVQDYELSFEWTWDSAEGGNSGLLLHAIVGTSGFQTWPSCIEVQLQSGMAGDIFSIGQLVGFHGEGTVYVAPGAPVARLSRQGGKEKAADMWNAMKVVAKKDSLEVYLNGDLVNSITGVRPFFGAIALQSEGTPIRFRNITLTSLAED
ncbi:MAG: 3-keto-disaccharide hydrolase [Puniceicoccales bacterium]